MSLHIAQRKLLFSTQNIHNFEKLLCQQGAMVTQESYYHSLNVNQTRGKKRERGKWRGYSEGGAGTAPPSWKNAAFGAVALSAGAAIGKFYLQKIFFEKLTTTVADPGFPRLGTLSFGQKLIFTARQRIWGKVIFSLVSICLFTGEGSHMTVTHDTLDLTLQGAPDLGPARPPDMGHWDTPLPTPHLPLVVKTGNLFKLVHFEGPPMPPTDQTSSGN